MNTYPHTIALTECAELTMVANDAHMCDEMMLLPLLRYYMRHQLPLVAARRQNPEEAKRLVDSE